MCITPSLTSGSFNRAGKIGILVSFPLLAQNTQDRRREVLFWRVVADVLVMVIWFCGFGPEVASYVMVGGMVEEVCSSHCAQEAKKKRKGPESQYPFDLMPPIT
jgi:hypothetical protein